MSVPTETLREWVEDFDEHGGGADLTEDVVDAVRELLALREKQPRQTSGAPVEVCVAGPDDDGMWTGTALVNGAVRGEYVRVTYEEAHAKARARAEHEAGHR